MSRDDLLPGPPANELVVSDSSPGGVLKELEVLDRGWLDHLLWRKGYATRYTSMEPGKYAEAVRGLPRGLFQIDLVLRQLPVSVRDAVLVDIESAITALVDHKYAQVRSNLMMGLVGDALVERELNKACGGDK